MKAVILCAGGGTRLRPLTINCPKPLLPIHGKPLLEYHIELLKQHDIFHIAINLHYLPDMITDYFGSGENHGVHIHYSFEDRLRGTAGALVPMRDYLDETFLVLYGDIYIELDITRMFRFHREKQAMATLAVHESSHPEDSDIVGMDEESQVLSVHHKPGNTMYGNLGNAGVYIMEPVVLNYIPKDKIPADFIKDVFPGMITDEKAVYGYNTDDFMQDMGTYERYEKLNRRLKQQ